ncbi:MAG: hypothetical protein IPI66_12135 [Chitinophagaceae bacterium]|nr:hypothetical protein [Chitinophagaceae bacterium]MBL0056313.1 hypothetical protein [Chitinophagaceae bacterium]
MDNKLVFEKLFNRDLNDNGNIALLEKVVAEHPYFAPARFFLLQQSGEQATDHAQQVSRTALFFNNPHWLKFQLEQTGREPEPVQQEDTIPEQENMQTENTDNNDDDATLETGPVLTPTEPSKGITTDAMLFEPMHMVDYFASQGIKLSEEALNSDKLGKQLKSFTEWLKTMKKIHTGPATMTGQPGEETDKNVQQLADKSNTGNEVLTEAMAEVLVKQGKQARALEVYEKLSLLNPSKSAYFAAKIAILKGI